MKAALLRWFERHQRRLPWRATKDPYRIWVSEVMLQQTRVETVIPYYERFVARFPRLEDLAAAEVDEVVAIWSGLGYYRRARQLHRAAQEVVAQGAFPTTPQTLQELPGIGPYTAAAVASIAFDVAVPVTDGNAERVISRLLALRQDPRTAAGHRRVREAAAALLDPTRPGDSNQALMELGATVCTPTRPHCGRCPLRRACRARAAGDPQAYPRRPRRRRSVLQRCVVAVVRQGAAVLLFRRSDGAALLAGTWELPWVEVGSGGASAEEALGRRYGGRWSLGVAAGRVQHGITYRRLELEVRPARVTGDTGVGEGQEAGWFSAAARRRLPLSSMVGKALRVVEAHPAPTAGPTPGAGRRTE